VVNLNKEKKRRPLLKNGKVVGFVRFVLGVAVIIAIGYVVFNHVPFIAKYDPYVIVTDSMEPVINVGDIVIIDTDVAYEDLEPGQIIAFYADITGDGHRHVVVHYLQSVTTTDDGRAYRTKPEVSEDIDPWILTDSDIVGIRVGTIPKIGPILMFAQSTIGRVVIILDVLIIYALFSYFRGPQPVKKLIESETPEKPDEDTAA